MILTTRPSRRPHTSTVSTKSRHGAPPSVYKPVSIGSLYFDAGTSFNPSAESLSLSAGTANLPPEWNQTYEFGTKWDLNKSRLHVNGPGSARLRKTLAKSSPTNSLLYVLAGNQRVSGVETDVRGRVMSRWDMLASYAYLDSRVVSSQFYPGFHRLPARERSEEHIRLLEHASPAAPFRIRRGHELRIQPKRQFNRAARSHNRTGQTGSRLLGVQCNGEPPGWRTRRSSGECLQPGKPLLLRRDYIPGTSCSARAVRRSVDLKFKF